MPKVIESHRDATGRVEMTIAKTDTPDDQPLGHLLKFKLEFALLMLNAGRIEMAADVFEQMFELIEQIDQ
jgi:hypothetical protein